MVPRSMRVISVWKELIRSRKCGWISITCVDDFSGREITFIRSHLYLGCYKLYIYEFVEVLTSFDCLVSNLFYVLIRPIYLHNNEDHNPDDKCHAKGASKALIYGFIVRRSLQEKKRRKKKIHLYTQVGVEEHNEVFVKFHLLSQKRLHKYCHIYVCLGHWKQRTM